MRAVFSRDSITQALCLTVQILVACAGGNMSQSIVAQNETQCQIGLELMHANRVEEAYRSFSSQGCACHEQATEAAERLGRPFITVQALRAQLRCDPACLDCVERFSKALQSGFEIGNPGKWQLLVPHMGLFPVLNDQTLSETTAAAVQYAVKVVPDATVLEVTRGGALYSMVAVAAGAAMSYAAAPTVLLADATAVVVKEHNPAVAQKVQVLRGAHPFGPNISGLPDQHRVDVLVWDVGTAAQMGAFGPRVVAPILAARDRLLRPGGRVIPAAVATHGMLVESPCLRRHTSVGKRIEGFCLKALNELRDTSPKVSPSTLRQPEFRPLSFTFPILDVDLTHMASKDGEPKIQDRDVKVTRAGVWDAVITWSSYTFEVANNERMTVTGAPSAGRDCSARLDPKSVPESTLPHIPGTLPCTLGLLL